MSSLFLYALGTQGSSLDKYPVETRVARKQKMRPGPSHFRIGEGSL